jgi:hypothetical protein
MATPVEIIVRAVLTKNNRGIKIRRAISTAWESVKTNPDRPWWRRKTTSAALMWEHAVNNTIAALADDRRVAVVPHHDTISFVIDDTVLLRIKKADLELMSCNVQTELASLFHEHAADLFGYAGLQRIEAVYVLSQFETDLFWVGIVAREQDVPLFHFSFDDLAPPAAELTPLPTAPRPSPADLATLKRDGKGKKPDEQSE